MLQAKDDSFVSLVRNSDKPVVAYFTAPWCPPCQMIKPHVKALAKKLDREVTVIMVDVDDCPQTMQNILHKSGVTSIPTFFLYNHQKDQPLERPTRIHTGPLSKRQLENWITSNLHQSGEQT